MRLAKRALTFDDVLLVPGPSDVLPREVSLETRLTKRITLNIPFISAAMDTVTESSLAIAIAQEGGLGIIHKNMSVSRQAEEVNRVKRYESGVVTDPITISPDMTVSSVIQLTREYKISGLPVVENGVVVGIVTNRDLRFEERLAIPVKQIMTPKEKLVVVPEGASLEEAKQLMHQYRLERVLVINKQFELKGLITAKDIFKATAHPYANKDGQGTLRVGAAVGVGSDLSDRVASLVRAGVDLLVIDTAHGHSTRVLEAIRAVRQEYPDIDLMAGNIATASAALALVEAGADAVKVGVGPGSICTTRIIAGVGVPQISAISEVVEALKGTDISVVADGGVRYSGDVAKAIAAGAHAVMMGSVFAGTEEAPGEVILYQGRSYKLYRGMGSLGAMRKGAADRYFQDGISGADGDKFVPEGVEGRVPYKGSLLNILYQLCGGLRSSMGYCGCRNIREMRMNPQFVEITAAGMRESHVHDVQITQEAPNYQAT